MQKDQETVNHLGDWCLQDTDRTQEGTSLLPKIPADTDVSTKGFRKGRDALIWIKCQIN